MASKAANQKKIDERLALIEEDIEYLEAYTASVRRGFDEAKLSRTEPDKLKEILQRNWKDYKAKVKSPACIGRLHWWERDVKPHIQHAVRTLNNLVQVSYTAASDEEKAKRRKELKQKFTVGTLVQLDPELPESSAYTSKPRGGLFERKTTRTHRTGSDYDHSTGRYITKTEERDCPPYYECRRVTDPVTGRSGGRLRLEKGISAVVIDNKTSKTYVELQVANHRYWMRRDDLIVLQN